MYIKNHYSLTLNAAFILITILLSNCHEIVNEHSPQVIPEIVSIGKDYASLKWHSAGSEYFYGVILSSDSIDDNDFRGVDTMYENIYDTIFKISNLDSETYYKVKVGTFGGNKAPNESWPPLRFKTELKDLGFERCNNVCVQIFLFSTL